MQVLRNLFLLLMLAGCTNPTILVPVTQKKPPVAIPKAQPLVLNNVEFKVYTADDLNKALIDMRKGNVVLFALDATNYQNMTLNLTDIKRYLDEQKAIINMLTAIVNSDTATPDPKTKPDEKAKPAS